MLIRSLAGLLGFASPPGHAHTAAPAPATTPAAAPAAAAPAAPKEPTLEQRVADIEAYMNNGARTPDVASKVAGHGPGHHAWHVVATALVILLTLLRSSLFYGG